MQNNIILIGFMGVGKGTTARAYSRRYGTYILDTDDLIASRVNKTIPEIFARWGEKRFRQMEQETADWIAQSVTDTLISCGGGFYAVNNLKALGTVVWLDASFAWIYARLSQADNAEEKLAKRPLFSDPDQAKKLYKERQRAYRRVADVTVNVEGKSRKEICKEIAKKCAR